MLMPVTLDTVLAKSGTTVTGARRSVVVGLRVVIGGAVAVVGAGLQGDVSEKHFNNSYRSVNERDCILSPVGEQMSAKYAS